MPELRPGPWLRLTALAAAAACCAAVVSGALELGAAHRGLAALALPPLVALVAAAWVAHRRLLVPSRWPRSSRSWRPRSSPRSLRHLALAALSLAAALGGRRRTLPRRARCRRFVARLRHADEAADHDAAAADRSGGDVRRRRRRAAALDLRDHDGRPRAGLRRGERAQPRARPRRRPADAPHRPPPSRRGARHARARARVRARALGLLVRAARLARERADRGARARRRTSSTCSSTRAG